MGKNKPEKLSRIEEWRRQQKEKNRQNNEKYNEKNREKKAAAAREKRQLKKAQVQQTRQHDENSKQLEAGSQKIRKENCLGSEDGKKEAANKRESKEVRRKKKPNYRCTGSG